MSCCRFLRQTVLYVLGAGQIKFPVSGVDGRFISMLTSDHPLSGATILTLDNSNSFKRTMRKDSEL